MPSRVSGSPRSVFPNGTRRIRRIDERSSQSIAARRPLSKPDATDFADQLALAIPDVEIAAVPVAADDQVGRDRDATDVIGHAELGFQREGRLAAPLNHGG